MTHALLGTHLLRRPIVRTAADGVEPDKAHALVVEGPVGLTEQLAPFLARVEVPIVLARDEDLADVNFFQDLDTELEFLDLAKLGQVAAEDQEVGRRTHRLHLLGGAHRLFDEARIEGLRIEMGVGNPGKLEWRLRRVSDVEGIEQRPPGEGLGYGRRPDQT